MSFVAALRAHAWAYPVLEAVHIIGIALLLGNLLALEVRLWLPTSSLPIEAFGALTIRLALAGFALAATSGLLMFSTQPNELLGNRVFLAKMGLLAAAGCNALWFHARKSLRRSDRTARMQMLLSSVVWVGVVFCGRWIAY